MGFGGDLPAAQHERQLDRLIVGSPQLVRFENVYISSVAAEVVVVDVVAQLARQS